MEQDETSVLVITNRKSKEDPQKLFFQNEVLDNGTLRFYKATFSDNYNFETNEIDSAQIEYEMIKNPKNWVLFVHGDAKTFEEAVISGYDIKKGYNVHVVVFSWPSKDPSINGYKNLRNSQHNVVKSLPHFTSLLNIFKIVRDDNKDYFSKNKFSLFLHSLGNLYLQKMVENKIFTECPLKIFNNIIINSAAVRQQNHKEWVEQISCQNQIYITRNRQDFNLKGARIFTFGGKQLGEVVHKPLADNAIYISFTESIGFRFPTYDTHTFFIGNVPQQSTNIKSFYTEVFQGETPDLNNTNRFIRRKDGLGYNIVF